MNNIDFINFLEDHLPQGITIYEIYEQIPRECWVNDWRAALEKALREHPKLNWQAYLELNPDIKEAGIDHIRHYIDNGIFENRELQLINEYVEIDSQDKYAPRVSVVISNYNNELYVEKCLVSVLHQSLSDIEIIFVDDKSTDNSLAIAKRIAGKDPRVRFIDLPCNQSQNMTRKIGVANANGKYLMFLDSDDFYANNACEIAYNAILKGYDFVGFNAHLVSPYNADRKAEEEMDNWINRGRPGTYYGTDIMLSIYHKRSLGSYLSTRIYNTYFAKKCFTIVEDGYFPRGQDEYQSLILNAHAKKILKIDNKLYYYRTRIGISTPDSSSYKIEQFSKTCDLIEPLNNFINNNGLQAYYERIVPCFLLKPFNAWLEYVPTNQKKVFFDIIVRKFGIINTLDFIIDNFFESWIKIAKSWMHYGQTERKSTSIKTVGMIYSTLTGGGIEKIIPVYCECLIMNGYEVVLILEKALPEGLDINPMIKVVYLPPYVYSIESIKERLRLLKNYIYQYNIDMIINQWWSYPSLLWEMILFQSENIPVLVIIHSDFCRGLATPCQSYPQNITEAVLRCADKVICLSIYAEKYFRIHGIDAEYLFNPITLADRYVQASFSSKTIVILGNIGRQVKQIKQALLILSEIVRTEKNIKMTIIGGFSSFQEQNEFFKYVSSLELQNYVRLTGWVKDTQKYLANASVYLSTSLTESFSLALCEAQALGLPAVIYDVPIMPASDNESVIKVPQNAIKEAASAICALLSNFDYWQSLSSIAQEKVKRFSIDKFPKQFIKILKTFSQQSTFTQTTKEAYRTIICTLAYHAEQHRHK